MNWAVVLRLLAGGALVCATGCFGSSSAPSSSPPTRTSVVGVPLVHVNHASVRYIAVPGRPHTVAVGGGAVWASTSRGVARLDPVSGRVVRLVSIPNHAEWDDLAYGAGAVWYLQSTGVLSRVSRATSRPVQVRRFGGDRALGGRTDQTWSWVAATAQGVCVGRLASGTTKGVLCFDPSLRHYGLVDGGPAPLVASSHATVFAGGSALKDISPQSRSASTFRLPRGATVTALTANGSSLWAAVESPDKRPRAVIYHIIGQTTVSTTPTGARYIQNIAVNDAGVWVLTPTHSHMVLSAVEPNGTLRLAATLPDDARSLIATAGALWTANFRDSTVARITGYASMP